jgi:hypothetical protein
MCRRPFNHTSHRHLPNAVAAVLIASSATILIYHALIVTDRVDESASFTFLGSRRHSEVIALLTGSWAACRLLSMVQQCACVELLTSKVHAMKRTTATTRMKHGRNLPYSRVCVTNTCPGCVSNGCGWPAPCSMMAPRVKVLGLVASRSLTGEHLHYTTL